MESVRDRACANRRDVCAGARFDRWARDWVHARGFCGKVWGSGGDRRGRKVSGRVALVSTAFHRARFFQELKDSDVCFLETDIWEVLEGKSERFDVIVLDVDNGPEAIAGVSNNRLYTEQGLSKIRTKLNPAGALLLWSAFRSTEFQARAAAAGFNCDEASGRRRSQ